LFLRLIFLSVGAGTVVQQISALALHEAVVVIGLSILTADFADDAYTLLAPVRIGIGAVSVRVFLASALAGAETLVLVVLSVSSANGVVQVAALCASVGRVGGSLALAKVLKFDSLASQSA
jgi:hypothetical protein